METKFIMVKRPKAKEFEEALWNQHKVELTRQYEQGGKSGVAQALRWVQSQNIHAFKPT
jgi:hypothetical protein